MKAAVGVHCVVVEFRRAVTALKSVCHDHPIVVQSHSQVPIHAHCTGIGDWVLGRFDSSVVRQLVVVMVVVLVHNHGRILHVPAVFRAQWHVLVGVGVLWEVPGARMRRVVMGISGQRVVMSAWQRPGLKLVVVMLWLVAVPCLLLDMRRVAITITGRPVHVSWCLKLGWRDMGWELPTRNKAGERLYDMLRVVWLNNWL